MRLRGIFARAWRCGLISEHLLQIQCFLFVSLGEKKGCVLMQVNICLCFLGRGRAEGSLVRLEREGVEGGGGDANWIRSVGRGFKVYQKRPLRRFCERGIRHVENSAVAANTTMVLWVDRRKGVMTVGLMSQRHVPVFPSTISIDVDVCSAASTGAASKRAAGKRKYEQGFWPFPSTVQRANS